MEYISYSFILFVAAGLVTYALLPKYLGKYILLFASLLFVWLAGGFFSFGFLLTGIAISFFGARAISRSGSSIARTAVFLCVLLLLLAPLFYFKYQNFVEYTVQLIYQIRGLEYEPDLIERQAPLGISFYTLMLISYTADIYMKRYAPEPSFTGYALYGSCFGHIVQGPIDAYDEVGRDMQKPGGISYSDVLDGSLQLFAGLVKKLIISERLALFVNTVFSDQASFPFYILILSAAAFSLQLYTDFSGCMDIVTGIMRMFGIRLSRNFRQPFFSQSIAEFWRRWHITLGAFFRKYIYIPLGGNRKGWTRKQLNMAVVFFLSGLWHGGNWTFVIGTGLLHCFYMLLGDILRPARRSLLSLLHVSEDCTALRIIRSLWVFLLVTIGFVLFRSDSLAQAMAYLQGIVSFQSGAYEGLELYMFGLAPSDVAIILIGLCFIFLLSLGQEKKEVTETKKGDHQVALEQGSLYRLMESRKEDLVLLLMLLVILFGCYGRGYDSSAFIYANF